MGTNKNMTVCRDSLYIRLYLKPNILNIGQEMSEKLQLYKGLMAYKELVDHCSEFRVCNTVKIYHGAELEEYMKSWKSGK
jgi:hypothetical protein